MDLYIIVMSVCFVVSLLFNIYQSLKISSLSIEVDRIKKRFNKYRLNISMQANKEVSPGKVYSQELETLIKSYKEN